MCLIYKSVDFFARSTTISYTYDIVYQKIPLSFNDKLLSWNSRTTGNMGFTLGRICKLPLLGLGVCGDSACVILFHFGTQKYPMQPITPSARQSFRRPCLSAVEQHPSYIREL